MFFYLRLLVAVIGGLVGFWISFTITHLWTSLPPNVIWAISGLIVIFFSILGYGVAPRLIKNVTNSTKWLEVRLHRLPTQELLSGAVGVITGLIIANLLALSFIRLPLVGPYIAVIASLLFAYLGWNVGTRRKDDLLGWSNLLSRKSNRAKEENLAVGGCPKILDTSVIIDGRIADICRTGFLEGPLVVPNFVLEELRHVADSADLLRRNRGRRGLDILNKLNKELADQVQVNESDYTFLTEVDSKLVKLAQDIKGILITNDFNLNKVAELQGLKVLNINELANAVRPVVLPGEELRVQVIKDGKEVNQGVGYLEDGTMVVVEGGRRFLGQSINLLVTSVLQTAAGRMIFAKPKPFDRNIRDEGFDDGGGEVSCLP